MMPTQRPSLLFLTPAIPSSGGTGLGMRAWAIRDRLARTHDVTVLAASAVRRRPSERLRRALRARVPGWYPRLYAHPSDWEAPGSRCSALSTAWGGRAARVHVFRLAMAGCAAAHLGRVPCHLDLDEREQRTRASIAALARRNGDRGLADALDAEAAFYAVQEREWLPRFDRLYAASRLEADALRTAFPDTDIRVLPNVVPLPTDVDRPARQEPFTLLFVGNLGYYPNQDAIRYLVGDIMPILRSGLGGEVRAVVVGGGASHRLQRLMAAEPLLTYRGYVDDLAPVYRAADAAIVPLRVGGGTRIKILEAFAHGVPVVATPEGAEGLEVTHGGELLVGATPEAFADGCVRLAHETSLREGLAARARAFVVARHTPEALDALE